MVAYAVINSVHMTPEDKEQSLHEFLRRYRSAVVAFSGGVDSSYLAYAANQVMGDAAQVVTALSPSVSELQQDLVRDFVTTFKLNHHFVDTTEMENPDYTANPTDRCYFCKSELFSRLDALREEWGVEVIFDGSNADDVGDYRPGRKAAEEEHVVSPLIEVGMTKEEIRLLSKKWGLPTWDLPAMPCLSSRLPYGVEVTPEKLRQVERAEQYLRSLGLEQFRVRHHEELARIEIASSEMGKILDLKLFEQISRELKTLGYQYVTLDLEGFRSGSLNELLQIEK